MSPFENIIFRIEQVFLSCFPLCLSDPKLEERFLLAHPQSNHCGQGNQCMALIGQPRSHTYGGWEEVTYLHCRMG